MTGPPNQPDGAQAPIPTATSVQAYGTDLSSETAARAETIMVSRVLRVQIENLSDAAWSDLRLLAADCARFCNAKMADLYTAALGYTMPVTTERRAAGRLSGDVYVALAREAFAKWRQHGKRILAGVQRLAEFQADRAIVCRGEYMDRGRRRRCALIVRTGDRYQLVLRLVKADTGPRSVFDLRWKPQQDEWMAPIIDGIAAGDVRMVKVSLIFERPGRKVFALLTIQKPITVPAAGSRRATLGPLESDGSLWLRMDGPDGRPINRPYTDRIMRIVAMKEHFAGIHRRLKHRARRHDRGTRAQYRRALIKAGSFGAWLPGVLHQWSRDIVAACRDAGTGELAIGPLTFQDLPMAMLIEQIKYKASEAGMIVVPFDPAATTTSRAIKRPIAKQADTIQRRRKALLALKEAVGQ